MMILVIVLCITNELFAIDIKEKILRTPATTLPFCASKALPCLKPNWAFTDEQTVNLPMYLYEDIRLINKFTDPNATCIICRKFQINVNFDLIALDISVSEWAKQLLATFKNGQLIDCIEAHVSWYSNGLLYIKQWRIDANEEVIVTWLKVDSPTPVPAFSNFDNIQAQRIDIHYKINADGKFQEIKQVKYQPQTYTKTYLTNMDKNLWEGDEVPVK